ERLEMGRLRGWVARHGDEEPELVNMYGITETTVHVSYRRIRGEEVEQAAGSGIGGGLAGMPMVVLEEEMGAVGVGMRGEIYVGGGGVARGYVGAAKQTAERFVSSPYSNGAGGERLYRSGDVGRWEESGEVRYEGRGDRQVKVRGYRV